MAEGLGGLGLEGSAWSYISGFVYYAVAPQLVLSILTFIYNRCRGKSRLTSEEYKASQRQIIVGLGVPLFLWWIYTTILDNRETNYYDIVQVGYDFETSEIKRRFYRMSKELHPDKGGNAEDFMVLQSAYEVLKDKKLRELYDRFGPGFVDCKHCNTIYDHYQESVFPLQISFFMGCVFVLWFFGGNSLPRLPFGMFAVLILGLQLYLVFSESSFSYGLQMLPFECSSALYILWGTLLSAQFVFSGVWGGDKRTNREILLQIESCCLQLNYYMHNLSCLQEINLTNDEPRREVVKLLKQRKKCFGELQGKTAAEMETFMLSDEFEFNLEKAQGKWRLKENGKGGE